MEENQAQTNNSVPGQTPPKSNKPYNLAPNVEAALAYLLSPITGIIVLVVQKDNAFVRFHAAQSIIFCLACFIIWNVSVMTTAILIGALLTPVVSMVMFVAWLILMWKAYNNEEWELPYLGTLSRTLLSRL